MKKIPCSVGILTYNSEANLRRALDSISDFSDIIISDGGSTDATLEIAKAYGCKIIDQYTKYHPGPDQYHPVEDFSRERNRLIDTANEDWFLWIDSDEYITEELREEIIEVCTKVIPEHFAYELPIALQSPDASVTYKRKHPVHQIRFFNLQSGGRFERKMHERYVFDREQYSVGRLQGAWCVPISKPDFVSYSRAVRYRLRVMFEVNPPQDLVTYLKKGIFLPLKRSLGVVFRYVTSRIDLNNRPAIPIFYYRNKLYSEWVSFQILTEMYLERSK
tara:strand:+ start:102 stop:929 length:828 start_codon:yes stop_codon:yes gene_type:complete